MASNNIQKIKADLEQQIRELNRQLELLGTNSTDSVHDSNAIANVTPVGNTHSQVSQPAASTAVNASATNNVDECIEWARKAFGPSVDMDDRIKLLKLGHFLHPPPTGDSWLSGSHVGSDVCIEGIMCDFTLDAGGKSKSVSKGKAPGNNKREKVIRIELIPYTDSEAKTCAIVRESNIGCDVFQTISNTLEQCSKDEKYSVVVRGCVRKEEDRILLFVESTRTHIMLINLTKPAEEPEVYGVQGLPITFPCSFKASEDDNTIRQLLGSFRNAWFVSDVPDFEELSKSTVKSLAKHIVAYRTSRYGGIIYIGLKLLKKNGIYTVTKDTIKLSIDQLSKFNMQIQELCKTQCPPCYAVEWTQKALPNDLKQRRDQCLYSIFKTHVKPSRTGRYAYRLVVLPGHEKLHLCKESDINLRKKLGSNSMCYSIEEFLSLINEAPLYEELRRLSSITNDPGAIPAIPVSTGESLKLLAEFKEESGIIEYKECGTADPVKRVVDELRDYSFAWMQNERGGTLRIGVSDKPPLATGVWMDSQAMERVQELLKKKFGGSLKREEFCIPSMTKYFVIKKYKLQANSSEMLSNSSGVLILWLKDHKEGFDHARRQVYTLWAKKAKSLYGSRSVVLPVNINLLSQKSTITDEGIKLFPVAICHGLSTPLSKANRRKMETSVKEFTALIDQQDENIAQYVSKYQFVDLVVQENILDKDYCILDITVVPPHDKGIYLTQFPTFYKIVDTQEDHHIGGVPQEMEFEEIVLYCDQHHANNHRDRKSVV